MISGAAQNKKTLTIVYVLAFSNLFLLTFMEYQHAQTMARAQREIFELQDDVVSLHERVAKLQKATFGTLWNPLPLTRNASVWTRPKKPVNGRETRRRYAATPCKLSFWRRT